MKVMSRTQRAPRQLDPEAHGTTYFCIVTQGVAKKDEIQFAITMPQALLGKEITTKRDSSWFKYLH